MTARGPNANPVPQLPRPDPTLETRPVPLERHFNIRSFGPGADPDIRQQIRTIKELDQQLAASGFKGPIQDPREWGDAVTRSFLHQVISEELVDYPHMRSDFVTDGTQGTTWVLYIMVTSYSERAQQNLERAVYKLVETVRRCFLANTTPPFAAYAEEVFKRFRVGVIQDQNALQDASDARVREEYNAHVRSLGMSLEGTDWQQERARRYKQDGLNRPYAPHSLDPCIVLDEAKIQELSTLSFPDSLEQDREALANVTIKLVDCQWRYPNEANYETGRGPRGSMKFYTGVDDCPIYDLPFIYQRLELHGGMEDMFPLSVYLDDH